mgnify:CR=1 FL=1
MALNNDTAQRQALKRAMRIAEIRVEDAEDMNACVNDLVKTAGLDETSARIVAAAYRESMMPSALEAEGIDPSEFMGSDEHGTQMTADFANDPEHNSKRSTDKQKPGVIYIVKSVCLVVAIVSVILILVYIIYKKWKKHQTVESAPEEKPLPPPIAPTPSK